MVRSFPQNGRRHYGTSSSRKRHDQARGAAAFDRRHYPALDAAHKHHPANERIKREYFIYLKEANRMTESSVDQIAAAITLFEKNTGFGTGTALSVWLALIAERSGQADLDTKKLIALVGDHWKRGLELLDREWEQAEEDVANFVKRLVEVAELPTSGGRRAAAGGGAPGTTLRPISEDKLRVLCGLSMPRCGKVSSTSACFQVHQETKGDQLENLDIPCNPEVLKVLSDNFAWDDSVPAGTLELVKDTGETVEFTLILMSEWKSKLPEFLRPESV